MAQCLGILSLSFLLAEVTLNVLLSLSVNSAFIGV